MPPVSSGLKKRVRAKLSILAKLQGVLATTRRERRPDDQLVEEEVEVVELQTPDLWADSFESLLSDYKGQNAFTLFLRKEYSEENMQFWTACSDYADITDEVKRKERVEEIYSRYLSESATQPINIDSLAKKQIQEDLASAPNNIFDCAKTQIYTLMKTDSYRRFLKSDFSKVPVERAELSDHQAVSPSHPNLSNGENAKGKSSPFSEGVAEGQLPSSHYQDSQHSRGTFEFDSTYKAKLEGRSAGLGSRLDTERLLANIQANTITLPTEETTPHNDDIAEMIIIPKQLDDDSEPNSKDASNLHLPLGRSKSDTQPSPCKPKNSSKRMTLPQQQLPVKSTAPNVSLHSPLSTSAPHDCDRSHIFGMLPNDLESSDEEPCNGGSKSFYLLRRLSHSLDHMIELEQAGIHSSNLDSIRELNDKMQFEALPSVEIERFLNTAESFTCQSTCSCAECEHLKKEEIAGTCLTEKPHISVHSDTGQEVSALCRSQSVTPHCDKTDSTFAQMLGNKDDSENTHSPRSNADLTDVCRKLTSEDDPINDGELKNCTKTFIDDLTIQPSNHTSLTT